MESVYQVKISNINGNVNKIINDIRMGLKYLFFDIKKAVNSLMITLFKPDAFLTNQLDIIEVIVNHYQCELSLI